MIHTQLPIYNTGVRLLKMGYFIQLNMPRGMKSTLGEKIVKHTAHMLDLMALANATQKAERVAYLEQLRTQQRAVEALLRVGHEMKLGKGQVVIATSHWSTAVLLLGEIGAQCTGWIRSAEQGARSMSPKGSHA